MDVTRGPPFSSVVSVRGPCTRGSVLRAVVASLIPAPTLCRMSLPPLSLSPRFNTILSNKGQKARKNIFKKKKRCYADQSPCLWRHRNAPGDIKTNETKQKTNKMWMHLPSIVVYLLFYVHDLFTPFPLTRNNRNLGNFTFPVQYPGIYFTVTLVEFFFLISYWIDFKSWNRFRSYRSKLTKIVFESYRPPQIVIQIESLSKWIVTPLINTFIF